MTTGIKQFTYRVRVARSAENGIGTGWQDFEVALEERMTVLDALFRIQRKQGASLSFRCAGRVGSGGTCAVYVNGIPCLACRTRVRGLDAKTITVGPLPHLP